jgi:hypothetical protein
LIVCQPSGDTGRDAIESFRISPDNDRVVYLAETVMWDDGRCDKFHELFISGEGITATIFRSQHAEAMVSP